MPSPRFDRRSILGTVALFVAYVATAKLGLRFDAVSGVATTVWPPTGIALAALLRLGLGVWPGITAAAFLVNVQAGGVSVLGAAVIACGNTLEAVLGAAVLRRLGFRPQIDRLRDVAALVLGAGLVSTTVSASLGTFAVWATAPQPPAPGYAVLWSTWWIGDLMGDLLVAPLLLTWSTDPRVGRSLSRLLEALFVAALLVASALVSFGAVLQGRVSELLRGTYLVWPYLIWAALRFGQRGASLAMFIAAAVVVGCTATGHGPFLRETPHDSLRLLQVYLGVTAVTVMTLAAALAERRRAIMTRDDFLSIASHELRTPLTALKLRLDTVARLLSGGVADDSPTRVSQAVTASQRHVGRLERLVDDLLDVSRLRADRMSLAFEPTDLAVLVRDATAQLGEELARTGSVLELDLAEGVQARVDHSRVEQVVTNLVGNALKYAPGSPVHVSLRLDGARARIAVRDRGQGIPKEEQARIFEPYRRLASARNLGGLGLGLYIGRQIAEAHGGSLTVESAPDAGALFVLQLPLEPVPRRRLPR
jgi:signal transduction histidine kinase